MSGRTLERASDFIYRNARRLERALFACRFEGGPRQAVVDALLAYRNRDGGFGHGLEPDVRSPESMALHCEFALLTLSRVGAREAEIAAGVARFLAGIAEADGRVPLVSARVVDHPHANHFDSPPPVGTSPNPTASLAGLLLEQGCKTDPVGRAVDWAWRRAEQPIGESHEILCALHFLERAPDRERARACALALRVAGQAEKASLFQMEPETSAYGLTPLTLCPSPDSIARPAFPDAVFERHLDALEAAQQDDGGWPITHPPLGPGMAWEWRGRWTIDALDTLHAWGRI